jgi:hypothetical protein
MTSIESKLREAFNHFTHIERVIEAYDVVLDDIDDWAGDDWEIIRGRLRDMRVDVVEERDRMDGIVQELSKQVSP